LNTFIKANIDIYWTKGFLSQQPVLHISIKNGAISETCEQRSVIVFIPQALVEGSDECVSFSSWLTGIKELLLKLSGIKTI